MSHRPDNNYRMFTNEGNKFVDDFILGNLLDMARIGYFAIEKDHHQKSKRLMNRAGVEVSGCGSDELR